jgi:hypothetical protein
MRAGSFVKVSDICEASVEGCRELDEEAIVFRRRLEEQITVRID